MQEALTQKDKKKSRHAYCAVTVELLIPLPLPVPQIARVLLIPRITAMDVFVNRDFSAKGRIVCCVNVESILLVLTMLHAKPAPMARRLMELDIST